VGNVLRAPVIPTPFRQMMQDQPTLVLFAVFVVIFGPIAEELAFRGFIMPLLMRSFGSAIGIIVTGAIFGSIHGYEYAWAWQYMLVVGLAGMVFGWLRYKTGSTAAAAAMHSTFNLTQFVGFLMKGDMN